MKNNVLLFVFISILAATGMSEEIDAREFVSQRDLPELFRFEDGTLVVTKEDWIKRREEMKRTLLYIQYGTMPSRPDRVSAETTNVKPHKSGLGTEHCMTLTIDS